jgi:hypothetical protein
MPAPSFAGWAENARKSGCFIHYGEVKNSSKATDFKAV